MTHVQAISVPGGIPDPAWWQAQIYDGRWIIAEGPRRVMLEAAEADAVDLWKQSERTPTTTAYAVRFERIGQCTAVTSGEFVYVCGYVPQSERGDHE